MLEQPAKPQRGPEPTTEPQVDGPTRIGLRGPLSQLEFLKSANESMFFSDAPGAPSGGWQLMAWSVAASVIDGLVVFSLVCLFLYCSLVVESFGLSRDFALEGASWWKTGVALFFFLHSAYLILLRIFLGSSFGEWACDLRLGLARQRFSSGYSLAVLCRFAVVLLTGVVVLPILSLLTGVDWAGRLSGLPLVLIHPPRRTP